MIHHVSAAIKGGAWWVLKLSFSDEELIVGCINF
jgi:hypothetical protein